MTKSLLKTISNQATGISSYGADELCKSPDQRVGDFRNGCNAYFRMRPIGLLATMGLLGLVACERRIVTGPAPSVEAPSAPPAEPYRSSLSATVRGTVDGSGTAGRVGSYTKSFNSKPNEAIELKDAVAQGDEEKECGPTYTVSQARSNASFTPLVNDERRMFGFSLSADVYSRAGVYQTSKLKLGWCSGMYETPSQSTAAAAGEINFSYLPLKDSKDALLLKVTDAKAADVHLRLEGPGGAPVPLHPDRDDFLRADIAGPGVYVLKASVTASANGRGRTGRLGNSATAKKKVSVGVQSLRDALAFGFSRPGIAANRFTVRALLPDTTMTRFLIENLFSDTTSSPGQRRWYPCLRPKCDEWRAQRVFFTDPKVSVQGGALVIDMKIGGEAGLFRLFGIPFVATISGTARAYGQPVMSGDTIRYASVVFESVSESLIVQYATAKFADRAIELINEKARYSTKALVESAKAKVAKAFPIRIEGGVCLSAVLTNIEVPGITLNQPPDAGVDVWISVLTEPGTFADCSDPSKGTNIEDLINKPKGSAQQLLARTGVPVQPMSEQNIRLRIRETLGLPAVPGQPSGARPPEH
jgi:hypothetical protein